MNNSMAFIFETTDFQEFAEQLRARLGSPTKDSENVFNKHMKATLKGSHKNIIRTLKYLTPKGPTGNLKRSVGSVVREYRRDRGWFIGTGYRVGDGGKVKIKNGRKVGTNALGYHQGLVEFGTKNRRTNSRIASSYDSRGAFTTRNMKRGKSAGQLRTTPKPPKGFFKTAPVGDSVELGKMQAQHPVKGAMEAAGEAVGMYFRSKSVEHIEKAYRELQYIPIRRANSKLKIV